MSDLQRYLFNLYLIKNMGDIFVLGIEKCGILVIASIFLIKLVGESAPDWDPYSDGGLGISRWGSFMIIF